MVRARAFIEAAEWNQAQLSSLARTPFRRLGWARKVTILGRTVSIWWKGKAAEEEQHTRPKEQLLAERRRSERIKLLG